MGEEEDMTEVLRYFFRCHDCLSVFALEKAQYNQDRNHKKGEYDRWETPEGLPVVCPCGGAVFFMGPVTKHHVYDTFEASACDGRCTEAKGNSCDCVCGGVNHGSGKTVTISVRQDIDAPQVKGIDYSYGEACRKRRASIKAPFVEAMAFIKNGQRVEDKQEWSKARRTIDYLRDAYWAFTKAKRENIFKKAEAINESMIHSNVY